MKKTLALFALAACAALTSLADWKPPKDYQKMTKGKRVCVKVETIYIDGKKHWVKYYQRDGKPDWIRPPVETNAVKMLKGHKQNNAIENARQAAEVEAEPAREIKKAAKNAAKKDAKVFENEVKNLEKARDKSESQDFKDLYQRTIDLWMSEINAKK